MGSDPTFNLDLVGRRNGNNRRQDTVWRRSNQMSSYLLDTTLGMNRKRQAPLRSIAADIHDDRHRHARGRGGRYHCVDLQ